MTHSMKWQEKINWFSQSLWFCRTHFLTIFGLGLVAAFGRAIQLGAFGPVSAFAHILLEVVIESVRLLVFLYALGLANIQRGAGRVARLITKRDRALKNWTLALQQIKKHWTVLLLNLIVFFVFAWLINLLIDYTAYQTCLYMKLKANQIISNQSSEWVLILFFKNISVIPFTLVFNAVFLLWITNRLTHSLTHNQKINE